MMNRRSFLASLSTPALLSRRAAAAGAVSNPRERRPFNDGWRFFKGEAEGAERPEFSDSAWSRRMQIAVQPAGGSFNGKQNGARSSGVWDRSLEQEWLKQHGREFALDWVALDGAELVAHGKSARQVLEEAKTKGYHRPLIVQVPEQPELPFGGW
jgi:hypothetical protein